MKKIDPAQFNKWIKIVSDNDAIGTGGSITENPATVWEGWAAIWPVSAREARENRRVGETVTHNIRMYYRDGISSKMRVEYDSRSFEIKGKINPDEGNFYLDLVCEERL